MKAVFQYDNHTVELLPGKKTFLDECYIDFTVDRMDFGQRIRLDIHPKRDLLVKEIQLILPQKYSESSRIACFGAGSHHSTRIFKNGTPQYTRLKKFLKVQGPEIASPSIKDPLVYQSWHLSYIQDRGPIDFFCSLKENTGFTIFQHLTNRDQLMISKDIGQLQLSHSFPAFDLFLASGDFDRILSSFNQLIGAALPKVRSWIWSNSRGSTVGVSDIAQNLEILAKEDIRTDEVLINHGFAAQIGDWSTVKPDQKDSWPMITQYLQGKELPVGLALSPLVCEAHSQISRSKKEWLLKDGEGKPVRVGRSQKGKTLYCFDFYHPGFQEYLAGLFYTVFDKWKFNYVYLDWLIAGSVVARPHKTRGQILNEIVSLLDQLVGDKEWRAGHLPLTSFIDQSDLSHIAATSNVRWQAALSWDQCQMVNLLRAALSYWPLTKSYLKCAIAPVYLSENRLNVTQQNTVISLVGLLGSDRLICGDVRGCTAEQWSEIKGLKYWEKVNIQGVNHLGDDRYRIDFKHHGQVYVALCNLDKRPAEFSMKGNPVKLSPFETLILLA